MTSAPRLGWIVLYVDDVDRSLRFYEEACRQRRRFRDPSGTYAELETGTTALALCDRSQAARSAAVAVGSAGTAPTANLTFVVDDVAAAFAHAVACGAVAVREPFDTDWGQTCSYVLDPDGTLVELATEVTT